MTGGTGTAPGTDYGWLAKVLAGNPVACGVLALARSLPDAKWDAFASSVKQVAVGMPAAEALAALRQEIGQTPN